MVIYCDSGGNVKSVPSMVTYGETLTDITIITPQQNSAVLLKIEPPTGEVLPDMICTPIISKDGLLVYNAKIHKGVTAAAGRCYYQLLFVGSGEHIAFDEDGNEYVESGAIEWESERGSFNVQRGTNIDVPVSADILKDYAIEELYSLLASVTQVQLRTTAVENKIGIEKELETVEKTIIGAINAIHRRPTVSTDKTLKNEDSAADAKVVGDKFHELELLLIGINEKITNFFDSDEETLDELSELIANIVNNRDTISKIAGSKADKDVVNAIDARLKVIEDIPFAEEVGF